MPSNGNPLRILIVTQFYYPDVTACAFRMHETAQLLSKMGCDVSVVAGIPHKGTVGNAPIDDGNVKVTRVEMVKYTGGGKWNYILHYLSFMWNAIKAGSAIEGNFDVVWASSPPLFTGIAGWVIARKKAARFCLDIRDIWPESAVVAGQLSVESPMFKAAKIIEKWLYGAAQKITCVSKPMAAYIEGICKKKPEIIYNSVPSSMVAENVVAPEANPNPLTILYVGNLGRVQNLPLIADAAKLLQDKGEKRILFKLVGDGAMREEFEKTVKEKHLDNIEIAGLVAKDEAMNMIRNSHALMLHLKDDGIMDKTIPSKLFDYMAAGRPILYGLKGEACEILGTDQGNLYYDPAKPAQLVAKAEELLANYNELASKAAQNHKKLKDDFLRDKMAEKLLNFLK